MKKQIQEEIVSFETAQLAQDVGFDLLGLDIYPLVDFYGSYKAGELSYMIEESGDEAHAHENMYFVYAPTQSILQRWLRENYSIHICVMSTIPYGSFGTEVCSDNFGSAVTKLQDTYEEAMELALIVALKLIKSGE